MRRVGPQPLAERGLVAAAGLIVQQAQPGQGGLFLVGVLYDFWTLNTQVSIRNAERLGGR